MVSLIFMIKEIMKNIVRMLILSEGFNRTDMTNLMYRICGTYVSTSLLHEFHFSVLDQ
jgi:hypothetical protein